MIICRKHGPGPLSLASLDLAERIAEGRHVSKGEYIRIDYEYLEEVVDRYYLDLDTAARYGLSKSEQLPLSDEFPAFVHNTRPVCFKCLDELFEKSS